MYLWDLTIITLFIYLYIYLFSGSAVTNTRSFIYQRPLKMIVIWLIFLFVDCFGGRVERLLSCEREWRGGYFLRNWHQSLLLLLFKQEKKTNWHLIFPGRIRLFSQLLLSLRDSKKMWFSRIVAIRSVCWFLTYTWHSLEITWQVFLQLTHLNKHVILLMWISLLLCPGAPKS